MPVTTHRLQFPLSAEDARRLRAGDQVIIDGEAFWGAPGPEGSLAGLAWSPGIHIIT